MKLIHINKIYHNKHNDVKALNDINLEFFNTGMTMILGPSGCGKTTLLNIMSGREKDYTGECVSTINLDYLTQEFNLFETMSVYDNLRMVQNNNEQINIYLDLFDMSNHSNVLVNKLSNGQKKRVQFIRALLKQPSILLCDEPTVALDYDTTKLLMDTLKKLSSNIQIVVVTHDVALVEKYADRVIKMNKGTVLEDKIIHKSRELVEMNNKVSKNKKEHFMFFQQYLKARVLDYLGLIGLSLILSFSIFLSLNLFKTINEQTDYNEAFKKAENLIVSLPYDSHKGEKGSRFSTYYTNTELYDLHKINKLVEEMPEIIAVEAYYSSQYEDYITVCNLGDCIDTYKSFEYTTNKTYTLANRPLEIPFIMDRKLDEWGNQMESLQKYLRDSYNLEYQLALFELVNNHDIPILYGVLPKEKNEVVIARDTADIIMELYNYSTYEELIGIDVLIGAEGKYNSYTNEWESYQLKNVYGESEIKFKPIDEILVTITGISSVKNDYMNMIFFDSGLGNNAVLNNFVIDNTNLGFDYVRFLVEPNSDYDTLVEKINVLYPSDKGGFVRYAGEGIGDNQIVVDYRKPTIFFRFVVIMIIVIMMLGGLYYIYSRNRIRKESEICKSYGYNVKLLTSINIISRHLIVLLVLIFIVPSLSNIINSYALQLSYEKFLSLDNSYIFIGLIISIVYSYLLEGVYGGSYD